MRQFLTFEKDIKPNVRVSQVIGPWTLAEALALGILIYHQRYGDVE